jgi:hypothetical protein
VPVFTSYRRYIGNSLLHGGEIGIASLRVKPDTILSGVFDASLNTWNHSEHTSQSVEFTGYFNTQNIGGTITSGLSNVNGNTLPFGGVTWTASIGNSTRPNIVNIYMTYTAPNTDTHWNGELYVNFRNVNPQYVLESDTKAGRL